MMRLLQAQPLIEVLRRRWLVGASFVATVVLGCSPVERLPNAYFSAPAGMALAGEKFDHLFVANAGADVLQVMALAPNIADVDLVPSPARFLPLDVPIDPSPLALAATADGRYVVAHSSLNSTLTLVNAETFLRVRGADGSPLSLQLPTLGAEPTAMVGATQACQPSEANAQTLCVGRVYVAVRQLGQVAVVDVRQASDGSLTLVVDRTLTLGGAPLRLALDPKEVALFSTDADLPQVWRYSLQTDSPPSLQSFALGSLGGPIAVSHDGSQLVVGRPLQQDVVVLASSGASVAVGDLAIVPANTVLAPVPQCLLTCGQADSSPCLGAHQADTSLCVTPQGFAAQPNSTYDGLYLASMPTQLVALGLSDTGACIQEICPVPGGHPVTAAYAELMAVASLDGSVRLIGLRRVDGTPVVHLLDQAFCQTPSLVRPSYQAQPLEAILAACPSSPAGAQRFACVAEAAGPGVVGVLRGQANGQSWGVVWEGVLAGGEHSNGGGQITAGGALIDPGAALDQLNIQPQPPTAPGMVAQGGDILEIITAPRADHAACRTSLLGGSSPCQMERRIAAVQAAVGNQPAALVLNPPLEPACFLGPVSYRIRAGDAFVVVPFDATGAPKEPVARLAPGDSFGPGLVPGQPPALFFSIRADLQTAAAAAACTRYVPTAAGAHPSTVLQRDALWSWTVADPFSPQQLGLRVDSYGRTQGPSGRIPGAMLSTHSTAATAVPGALHDYLGISFSGSNGVLLLAPYANPTAENRDSTSRLFQLEH